MMAGLRELAVVVLSTADLALLAKATAVLLGAFVLLRSMRSASASMRHVVVSSAFAALLLLLVSSIFLPPFAMEVHRTALPPASAAVAAPADNPGKGGTATEPPRAATSANQRYQSNDSAAGTDSLPFRPLYLLRALWLAGAPVFAAPILLALWRAQSLRRSAMAWPPGDVVVRELEDRRGGTRRVQVLRHEGVAAPMTCGFIRPAIVLPWDASEWEETDLRRALIHEVEHVRRADWIVQLLARMVCALYWFHPLVWRCWHHLHFEAERACDDAVVQQMQSEAYASQLVRLAERMSHNDARPILAMASPGSLAARVRSVLDPRRRRDRASARHMLGVATPLFLATVAIAPLRAVAVAPVADRLLRGIETSTPELLTIDSRSTLARATAKQDSKNPGLPGIQAPLEERFAAATVRRGIGPQPNGAFAAADMATVPRGRALGMVTFRGTNSVATGVADEFIATGVSMRALIEIAYGVGLSRPRPYASIEGVPSWLERFDIDARTPRPIVLGRGASGHEPPELRAMLRQLLADRFQLVAHWEPRDKVVYDLLRDGALGPRLQPCAELREICQEGRISTGKVVGRLDQSNVTVSYRRVGSSLREFSEALARDLNRPVIDRTQLEGPYHLELQTPWPVRIRDVAWPEGFAPPQFQGTLSAVPPNDQWRAFSDALREQLGLRMEPRIESEEVLVIDRVALPSYDR
jgi:uncharacterized protein (TIGR03435 family)